MIPILYTADERRFITNGIGRLSDCTRCIVTEERNGIYECEFDYPITGEHFDDIQFGRIVAVTHDDKHDIQPFVIYARSVPDLRGIVTFYAHHISYRLSDVVVMPYNAGSVVGALEGLGTYSVNSNPFTFWTDKTTVATFTNAVPRLARNMLGGEQNSILDVYGGGEYEFDKWTVKLHAHRGTDTNVEIRYGKNLVSLNQKLDDSGTYNAVVPYWTNGEEIVTLSPPMIVFSGATIQTAYLTDHNLVIIRTEDNEPIEVAYTLFDAAPMDLSSNFQEKPTQEQLRAAAIARFNGSNAWLPSENLTVDFVQLWQTEEYKDYAPLQRVSLCDTVSVYYAPAGVEAVKQKVVKVIFNVLLDRYDSMVLGQVQTSLGQTVRNNIMQDVVTTSMMDAAVNYATDLIRGGLGGYVVMTPGANGYPQEILIMDSPSVDDAVNVWRFNQGGLGHSHSGYQGPFDDIALTQDGRINASMITTGIINANLIRAGIITDESGLNFWDLASGQFSTKQGIIGPFTIGSSGLTYAFYASRIFSIDGNGFSSKSSNRYASYGYRTSGAALIRDTNYQPKFAFYDKYYSDGIDDTNLVGTIYGQVEVGTEYTYPSIIISPYGSAYYSFSETQLFCGAGANFQGDVDVYGTFTVHGTKSRVTETDNYSERLLYAYETPTPLFGDIGEAVIDSDGFCYVDIDDIFSETIAERVEYQVFLQKEGEGDCWIAEKQKRYFVIQGTPNLKVAWELKAKQRDYDMIRLEQPDNGLDEYEHTTDADSLLDSYINEQEELLYG